MQKASLLAYSEKKRKKERKMEGHVGLGCLFVRAVKLHNGSCQEQAYSWRHNGSQMHLLVF